MITIRLQDGTECRADLTELQAIDRLNRQAVIAAFIPTTTGNRHISVTPWSISYFYDTTNKDSRHS